LPSPEASSFFEKVQLHLELADLLVELVFLGVGLLAHLLASVAEYVGQPRQRLFLPAADLGGMHAEHLGDLRGGRVSLDGFHRHFRFQAGRVILAGSGHAVSLFSMPAHHLRRGRFSVQKMGSTTPLATRARRSR
jgi:hypothetical protein